MLDYVGGRIEKFDWMDGEDYDMRDIDEYALRSGCEIGCQLLYAYTVEGWGFGFLKPLCSTADTTEFKEVAMKENFMHLYIDCSPSVDFMKLYNCSSSVRILRPRFVYNSFVTVEPAVQKISVRRGSSNATLLLTNFEYNLERLNGNEGPSSFGSDANTEQEFADVGDTQRAADVSFFREVDRFDDELDEVIRAASIAKQQQQAEEMVEIGSHNEKLGDMSGRGESSSKRKQKGTYARHGIEFKVRKAEGYRESSSDDEQSSLSGSVGSDGIRSIASSCDEAEVEMEKWKKIRYVHFKEKDMKNPKFFPGLVFGSKVQVREALTWYSNVHQKPIWFANNDNKRMYVKCAFPCNFSIWLGKDRMLGARDWSVRKVHKCHSGCSGQRIPLCNSTFLAKALEDKFRLLPNITLAAIQVFVDQMFKIKISTSSAKKTKEKAFAKINGDHKEQFNLAFTYCKELMKAQPGSTCYVDYTEPDHPLRPCIFRRLYVCLKPLVEWFYHGCRRVIGLDGCHTKGLYRQQILTAVALDSNNGFWPIAWAVVEKENYETWKWFIQGLIQDMNIVKQEKYVIMSDKQKGLEQVLHDLLPRAARRNCVQHIYKNLCKNHKGGDYLRDKLWEIARSTNKSDFC